MPRNGLKNIVDIIDEKVMSIIDLLKKEAWKLSRIERSKQERIIKNAESSY